MGAQKAQQLMVMAGSVLALNGVLLLASPARFATLRTYSWLPERAKAALEWLGHHARAGRGAGALVSSAGVALLVRGMADVEPG